MRLLLLVVAGAVGLAGAACGLDSNGLADDGLGGLNEAGSPFDGTVGSDDASGNGGGNDVASSDDAGTPPGQDSGSGEDVLTLEDSSSPDSGPPLDSGPDASCSPPDFACTAATVPSGWTIAEYVPGSRPACSPGYGTPTDVVEGPTGQPAMCTCSCDVTTAGSCEMGDFKVTVNVFSASCGGPPVTSPAGGGACQPATANYSPKAGAQMAATTVPYTPGSCTPDPTESAPPVTYAGQGRICFDSTAPGTGCPNGGACAPAASGNGFQLCIVASGTQTCPTGFPKLHLVGTSVTDGRGCTACTCAGADAGPCANPMLTLFTDAGCGGGAQSIQADGTCRNFPGPTGGGFGPPTYVAYEYTAQVQGEGCAASPVFPDGGVSLTGPQTVCCQ